MLWPVAGIDPAQPLFERFGIGLRLENGRAVVDSLDEAGPLAGRDVRVEDVIAKVSWADGAGPAGGAAEAVTGPAVLAALTDCPWSRQLSVVVERDGNTAPPFNRLPAWENIASLHLPVATTQPAPMAIRSSAGSSTGASSDCRDSSGPTSFVADSSGPMSCRRS
jgi:hypothetical protein